MDKNNLKDKSNFLCGDLKSLKKIKHTEFDGVILFNIIDNLKPEDGKLVIKEINRILNTNGRVILKLNPYISQQEIGKRNDMQEISNDFYKESSGLFLWNISDDLLKEIISPYFYISSYKEIVFKEFNMSNRLYYLKKI